MELLERWDDRGFGWYRLIGKEDIFRQRLPEGFCKESLYIEFRREYGNSIGEWILTTADRRKVKESGDRNSRSYFLTSGTFDALHPEDGYVIDERKGMGHKHPGISKIIDYIRDNLFDGQYRYAVVNVAGVPELIVTGNNYLYPEKFLYVI